MEDFYRDDDGLLYDRVKWHTRKKHAFIESYLKIWVDHVKKNPPSLDIFDLFASSGLCYCEESKKYASGIPIWPGSAILAANCLENYPKGRTLFLNTYHQKEAIRLEQKKNLECLFTKYSKITPVITTLNITEAVNEACRYVVPNYPSLWILDPHGASDLPWEIVERIGNLRGKWTGKDGQPRERRPEMIITLMTYGLQMNVNINSHTISTMLGVDESEWRPKFDVLMEKYGNTRLALVELYAERLSNLYEKPPIIVEINTTNETAIVYVLFLCTDSNAGHYLMKLEGLKEYNTWIHQWKKDARKIIIEESLPKGQTKLF
jgi:three-Cys-motif partner protein